LVKLGGQALDLLELLDEGDTGIVAPEIEHSFGAGFQPMGLEEVVQFPLGGFEFFDHHGGLVHEPNLFRPFGPYAGEQGNGFVDPVLLAAEVKNVAVGFGGVEDAVGPGKGLNETVVLEVFVDIEGVEIFRIEAGQEHVHDNGDVDLFFSFPGKVAVGILLVLDALLHILVVGVEFAD